MHSVIGRARVERGLEAAAREGRVEGGIEPPLNGCQLVRERRGILGSSYDRGVALSHHGHGRHHRRGFPRLEGIIDRCVVLPGLPLSTGALRAWKALSKFELSACTAVREGRAGGGIEPHP